MALGDSYATRAELKRRLANMTATTWDNDLDSALSVASRGIEHVTGRQFNVASSATARVFYPRSHCLAEVDDISTSVGLIVKTDAGDAGTYGTTWSASDFQAEPLNGIVDGESGWPFYRLRAVAGRRFPTCTNRAPLQVTATWGWAAVPSAIKEACLILAEETYKLKEAPWGVANVGEWGTMRVRSNPMVMSMIAPYRLNPVLVA